MSQLIVQLELNNKLLLLLYICAFQLNNDVQLMSL